MYLMVNHVLWSFIFLNDSIDKICAAFKSVFVYEMLMYEIYQPEQEELSY